MLTPLSPRVTVHNLPPKLLKAWLEHSYSLTEKLKEEAGEARLQRLTQYWCNPDWWDKFNLSGNHKKMLHREILMWARQKPCWYARTIIPASTFQNDVSLFSRLQQESLGNLIFSNEEVKRIALIHYAINAQCIEYHWLDESMHENADILWLRLSTFSLRDHYPFFLVEILLPGLIAARQEKLTSQLKRE